MNHNLPIPLEDELALGLLGRFARLNGLPSITWAIKSIRCRYQEGRSQPMLWLIAQACNLDTQRFAAEHSMLPVLYPVSRCEGSEREASITQLTMLHGLSVSASGLRWCPECARLDNQGRGYSYWRRRHQINGIDWCAVHRLPLTVTSPESAISAPGDIATAGKTTVPMDVLGDELANPALQRLQAILLAWLHRPAPICLDAWAVVVRQRCRELDLRMGEVGKRPVVSDLIRELFPHSWLQRCMPEVACKQDRVFVRKVDGACIDRHVAYPALSCGAILAVLYTNAEDAISALESANQVRIDDPPEYAVSGALAAFLAGDGLLKASKKFGVKVRDVESALRSRCVTPHPTESISFDDG
ncbi:MAG: hypothetical protein HGA75_01940 [Thiobacillus sp.]|nr:hypothetical protein [Thiobacillus sp.]